MKERNGTFRMQLTGSAAQGKNPSRTVSVHIPSICSFGVPVLGTGSPMESHVQESWSIRKECSDILGWKRLMIC